MKKLLALGIAAAMLASCHKDRSEILKVYNWGDYIDEELIPEFEEWYHEQTGEKVKVIYQTFDINETMLSKIEIGHEDYDVVCPSDYIIERMLASDLLLPIDFDFGTTPNYIETYVAPYIKECFKKINGKGKDANKYSVAYMWGTTGILYNTRYVDEEDTHTWDIIRNPKYKEKIFIKDASRDIYGPISIYLHRKEIAEGKITMDELMMDSSDGSLQEFADYMASVKPLIAGWEADFGKEQMTQEHGWLNMTWSGDAVWAITEAADVGVELKYTVPDEGSNVWYDGWVIPRYAQNIKAASYFLNFLCRPDIAIRNMDFIGYVSAIASKEVLEAMSDDSYEETVDASYFFGDIPGAKEAHLNPTQYPDISVTERCTMMHDWGDETPKLISTWSHIKGTEADSRTIIIIGLFFALLLFFGIRKRFFGAHLRRIKQRKRRLSRLQSTH